MGAKAGLCKGMLMTRYDHSITNKLVVLRWSGRNLRGHTAPCSPALDEGREGPTLYSCEMVVDQLVMRRRTGIVGEYENVTSRLSRRIRGMACR